MADEDGDLFGSASLFDGFESNIEACPSAQKNDRHDPESDGDDDDIKEISRVSVQTVDLHADDSYVVLDETGSESGENEVVVVKGDTPPKAKSNPDVVEIIEDVVQDCASNNENGPNESGKMMEDKASQSTLGEPEAVVVGVKIVPDTGFCNCEDCPYLRELVKFKRDNELLIEQVHQLTSQLRVTSRKFADVEITFLNQLAEMRYRKQVEEFLEKLLEEHCPTTENASQEDFTNFCIDKGGSSQASSSDKDDWQLPSYSQEYAVVSDEDNEKAKTIKMQKNSCFNCLGDHLVTECPNPKDWSKISQNREEFLNRSGNAKQPRYHADEDLRFATFKPGVISKQLRHALDYRSDEVPFFIYKMRQLGYPPGWLKDAEITNSGLALYDCNLKAESVNNVNEVTGKYDVEVKYDPDRIIEYPGFNVPLQKGMRDNWRRYGFWPMQRHHEKSYMTMHLNAHDSASSNKRQSTSHDSTSSKRHKKDHNDCNTKVTDMEIENDIAPPGTGAGISVSSQSAGHQKYQDVRPHSDSRKIPQQEGNSPLVHPINPLSPSSSSEATTRANSPSLEDLELVKKNLMLQLKDDSDATTVSVDGSVSDTPNAECQASDKCNNVGISDSANDKSMTKSTKTTVVGASKSVFLGSPAIIQLSKGMSMPTPEMFSVGVSEHIPFENLPDSAGQYERMKGVIKKIRKRKL